MRPRGTSVAASVCVWACLWQCCLGQLDVNVTVNNVNTDTSSSSIVEFLNNNTDFQVQSFADALVVATNDCPPGYYCTAVDAVPVPCPAGTYQPLEGAGNLTQCLPCPVAMYCELASVLPVFCPIGTFRNETNAGDPDDCWPCPGGGYCGNATVDPEWCAAGLYLPYTGAVNETECQICPAGQFCPVGSMFPTYCPAGRFNLDTRGESVANCSECTAGSYCVVGSVSPHPCPAGTYMSVGLAEAESDCQICTPGAYCEIETVQPQLCPAGLYRAEPGATMLEDCVNCTIGHVCPTGTANPEPCRLGTYQTGEGMDGPEDCQLCGPGEFQNLLASTDCQLCGEGTYQTGSGATNYTECTLCGVGTFQTGQGMTVDGDCALCSPGGYQTGLGAAGCDLCGPGTYQTGYGLDGTEDCSLCGAGSYQTGQGMPAEDNCTLCPPDTFQNQWGQDNLTACNACPLHTHSPHGTPQVEGCVCDWGYEGPNGGPCSLCNSSVWCRSGTPNACPSHALAPEGSSEITDCLCVAGYYGYALNTIPCLICPQNYYCQGNATNLTEVCPYGRYSLSGAEEVGSCFCPPNSQSGPGAVNVDRCTCNPGYKRVFDNSTQANWACELCGADEICFNETLSTCPPNSFSVNGAGSYLDCQCDPGYYNTSVQSAEELCQPCEAGFFCMGGGHKQSCNDRMTSQPLLANESGCYCLDGYHGKGAVNCTPCQSPNYCTLGMQLTCPQFSFSVPYSSVIENCSCDLGYWGKNGGSCRACQGETFKDFTGCESCQNELPTDCKPCAIGTYSNVSGLGTPCTPCPEGSYSDTPGGTITYGSSSYSYMNKLAISGSWVTCSPYCGGGGVKLVDGNADNGAWSTNGLQLSGSCGSPTWVQISFPSARRLDTIFGKPYTADGRGYCGQSFQISNSSTFASGVVTVWSPGLPADFYAPPSTGWNISLSQPVWAQYVRWYESAPANSFYLEMEVYEYVTVTNFFPIAKGCKACEAGTYQTGLGMIAAGNCTLCPPGRYQPLSTGVPLLDNCTECGTGTYYTGYGGVSSAVCLSCGGGTYSTMLGVSQCDLCQAGTASTALGATSPSVCASCGSNNYSYAGSAACKLCILFSTHNVSGATTPETCTCNAGYSGNGVDDSLTKRFMFDTRSCAGGSYCYSLGPAGDVQYSSFPLGQVTVSSGSLSVMSKTVPRGVQIWTVSTSGYYSIVAAGAKGQDPGPPLYTTKSAGRGVVVSTQVYLNAGDNIAVMVGQLPRYPSGDTMIGGGGGTFVTKLLSNTAWNLNVSHQVLLVAGGGGGGNRVYEMQGEDGLLGTSGGIGNCAAGTLPSLHGGGGGVTCLRGGDPWVNFAPANLNTGGVGSGGGGFIQNGAMSASQMVGGKSFLNGGQGDYGGNNYLNGGFGGGGGAWYNGGSGGGYSGGTGYLPGAANSGPGGGGGSYDINGVNNTATMYSVWNQLVFGAAPATFAAGYNTGDGFVVIANTIEKGCATCPPNYYCPGGNTTIACPNGTYSMLGAGAVSSCVCPTNANITADGTRCACNPGFYRVAQTASVTKLGDFYCLPCLVNNYCVNEIQTACPANTTTFGLTTQSICKCSLGYVAYSLSPPTPLCRICKAGSWCPACA